MPKYSGVDRRSPPPEFGYQRYAADQPYDRPQGLDVGITVKTQFNPPAQKMVLDRTMRPYDDNW